MRVLLVAGVVALVGAAIVVPLPWAVVEPQRLEPVGQRVTIIVDAQFEQMRGEDQGPVTGEYLAVRHRQRAPAVHLLVAAVAPGAHVDAGGPALSPGAVQPLVAATMAGLGVVPRYADLSQLPVTAHAAAGVDPRSLGAALYAFDVGADQDLARGRRIAGIGRMLDGGDLVCTAGTAASVRAAADAGVDVVVVPSDCADEAAQALGQGARVRLEHATALQGAAQALLES